MSYINRLNKNFFEFLARRCFIETPFLPQYLKDILNIKVLNVKLLEENCYPYVVANVQLDACHSVTFYCSDNKCNCIGATVSAEQRKTFNKIYLEELSRQFSPVVAGA